MDAEPFAADVTLGPTDLMTLHRRVLRRSKARLVNVVLVVVSFIVAGIVGGHYFPHADIIPVVIMLYGGLILYLVLRRCFRDVIYRKAYGENSFAFQTRRYAFDAGGMRITAPYNDSFTAWPGISLIEKTRGHILLLLPGNTQGHIIPFSALPPGLKPEDAAERLEAWRRRAGKS